MASVIFCCKFYVFFVTQVWETKLHLSKAVMGLHPEEQQLLQRAHQTLMGNQQVMQQQQQQQQHHQQPQQPQQPQHHQQHHQQQKQAQQIIQIPTLTMCRMFFFFQDFTYKTMEETS